MTDLWNMDTQVVGRKRFWQLGSAMVLSLDIQHIWEQKVSKEVIWHPREKEVKTSAGRGQHWPWYVGLCQLDVGFSPVANTTCGNRV